MTEPTNPPGLSGVNYPTLYQTWLDAKADAANATAWLKQVEEEISNRLAPSVLAALDQQGKTTGTVNLDIQGGLKAKGVVDKKVEWDSEKLLALAVTMPIDQAKAVFKFAVSVPEKNYEGVKAANPVLGKAIDEARTVKHGAPKVTLSKED